jgi:hypothetical protein
MRARWWLVGVAVVTIALSVLAPVRQMSGDTVPGRVGGLVMRCGGTFDLSRVDWFQDQNKKNVVFYYQLRDRGGGFSSVFGPGPAVLATLGFLDVGDGDTITDASLRQRERAVAAFWLAITAVLLAIACRSRTSWRRSIIASAIAVLSFAGAATLGQGVWQATTCMPFLVGGLALVVWRERLPRLSLGTIALLTIACLLRPNVVPLASGIALMWALKTRSDWKAWLIAIGAAIVVATPFVVYNATHYYSPLPIGQWIANRREAQHVFKVTNVIKGVVGLFASPSRGILWFAPVAIVGAVRAPKPIALGIALQFLMMAAFFKWHGGMCYGPRLLSELVWIAMFGACTLDTRWLAPTATITIIVGQLGLWFYWPGQWEVRRRPEAHKEAFWDFRDNIVFSTLTKPNKEKDGPDSPPRRTWQCKSGRVFTR